MHGHRHRRYYRGEEVRGEELIIQNPARGEDLNILVSAAPVRRDGEIVAAVSVFQDITKLRQSDLRSLIAYVPQEYNVFRNLTVRDNLFLATRGVSRSRFSFVRPRAGHPSRIATQDLLERTRLAHLAERLVSELAHGQLRQLEIGMALAGAPRLILFDEPAAGLSPAERRELVALLSAFPPHMGYVLIEHDLDIALRVVERVTILHNGRLLKHGTPDEIENDAEVQAIYMGGKHGGGHAA